MVMDDEDDKKVGQGEYLDQLTECMQYFMQDKDKMKQATGFVMDLQKKMLESMGVDGVLENVLSGKVSGDDDIKEIRDSLDRLTLMVKKVLARLKRLEVHLLGELSGAKVDD